MNSDRIVVGKKKKEECNERNLNFFLHLKTLPRRIGIRTYVNACFEKRIAFEVSDNFQAIQIHA